MAYTKPQERKKEESERLTGERDHIKFIDLRFEKMEHLCVKCPNRIFFSATKLVLSLATSEFRLFV